VEARSLTTSYYPGNLGRRHPLIWVKVPRDEASYPEEDIWVNGGWKLIKD
jgi:hypothetical protein